MTAITANLVKELREATGLGMMDCKKALGASNGDKEKAIEYLRKQGSLVAAKRAGRDAKEGKVLLKLGAAQATIVEVNSETDFVSASDDFVAFSEIVLKAVADNAPADMDALNKLSVDGRSLEELTSQLMAKTGEKISISRFAVENLTENDMAETYSHMNGQIGVIVKLSADGPIELSDELKVLAKDLAMQVAANNPISIDESGVPSSILDKEREIYRELTLKEGKPAEIVEKVVEGRVAKYFKDNCLIKQIFIKDSKISVEKLISETAKHLKLKNLRVSAYHRFQLGQ